jgi:hypothetical protein
VVVVLALLVVVPAVVLVGSAVAKAQPREHLSKAQDPSTAMDLDLVPVSQEYS